MTFFEKTKLFFLPLRENKLLTFFSCIKFSTWGLNAILGVLIIRGSSKAIESNNEELYNDWIFLFLILFTIFMIVSWIFRKSDWPNLYHNIEKWIYQRYIPKFIESDNNYTESIGTGRIITIIKEGVKTWVDQLSFFIKESVKILVTGGFLFYLLSAINIIYAIGLIGSLVLMHILVVWIDIWAHKYRKIRTEEKGELSRKIVRIIMSKNEILQNNTTSHELTGVHSIIDKISNANDHINKALFGIFNLVRIFSVGIRLFVLIVLGFGVFSHTFSFSDFLAIMVMIIVFETFLFESTEFYKNFTKEFSDIEKLWSTFENSPKLKGYSIGKPFTPKSKNIEINNITYGYNETKIFEDFSLNIEKGKKIALVGASGGGKTTLMKLIAGYLHPDSGHISIMGNRLDKTALKTYYPHIGYLTQEPGVFDATIRENLVSAVSNPLLEKGEGEGVTQDKDSSHVTHPNLPLSGKELEQQLITALKLAHCDFVFELEKGLDTEIGERGVRLSGGQKQRLAIAKIFLKNPEIILLDEPTSALDSFSEEAITEALDELFQGRTVIIVAHRLQTVKKADDIIVLEGGKVVERGNHNSLIAEGGIYNKMLELQSGF